MPPADITRIEPQREACDCALAAIAMFTGESYEDVLRVVSLVDPDQGREGLTDNQVRKVLQALDTPVRFTRKVDLDEDYGLLRLADHMVLIRNGLVVENGGLWDASSFIVTRGYANGGIIGIFLPK